jgi:hypothetical protein
VNLALINEDSVDEFVLDRRRLEPIYLTSDLYIGMSLNITSEDKLFATLYYSTMAFHSSANAVHEATNLFLAFLTNNFEKRITTYNQPFKSNNTLYYGDEFIKYLACLDILPVSYFNMLNSIIIVLIMSVMVITVGRERISGSKTLQLLAGTKSLTYWVANYIFDVTIVIFNFTTMVLMYKTIDAIRNDPMNETSPLSHSSTIGYVYLLFITCSFSCCSLAYVWSFFFKSELVGFIVLAITLGVAAFLDMLFSFILLFTNVDTQSKDGIMYNLLNILQFVLLVFFPNVAVKHGLYNLKIRKNNYCINSMNRVFNCKHFIFSLLIKIILIN